MVSAACGAAASSLAVVACWLLQGRPPSASSWAASHRFGFGAGQTKLSFYKIGAKHAHHRSPPQYINTSNIYNNDPIRYIVLVVSCFVLPIPNIYRDTSVLIPVLSLSDFFLDMWSRRTPATNRRCLQKQVLGLFFPIDFVEKQPDAAFAFRHVQCVLSVCTALKDMHVFM